MKALPALHTAEAAALSLIAIDPQCLAQMSWDASLFAQDAHQRVFRSLARVYERTGHTGAVAVISDLESQGIIHQVGGQEGVIQILSTSFLAPGPVCLATAADYRAQLIRAAGYRASIQAWQAAEQDIYGMRYDLAELAQTFATAAEDKTANTETLQQQLTALINDLERRQPLEAFASGISGLDHALRGGIHRGELLVIGADTSGGKSILLHQAALQAALAGKKVALFSLEMPAKDILRRIAANLIGKRIADAHELLNGTPAANVATHRELSTAFSRLMDLPLIIRDNLTEVSEIDNEIRRLAAAKQCDLAIVDYLQIVTMPKADTREQAISELARRIKLTALKSKVAVMSATQLNDEGKIRESRAIGMHADHVVFIEHNEGSSALRIKKNRRGQRDVSIPCAMRGDISRIEDANP